VSPIVFAYFMTQPDIESMVYWNHMLYQVKSQWFC
jgi:hypothetical protein